MSDNKPSAAVQATFDENQQSQDVIDLQETVEITDINQFVTITAGWHANKIARLKNLLQVPQGMEVQVGDEAPFKLEGEAHKGFLLGVQLAIDAIGTLPFAYETEEAPQQPAEPQGNGG